MDVRDSPLEPLGYQRIVGLAASTALTVPARARYALLKTETQPVRWRDDGTAPTTTVGFLLDVGEEFWYTAKLAKFRAIETVATATLHASYYA